MNRKVSDWKGFTRQKVSEQKLPNDYSRKPSLTLKAPVACQLVSKDMDINDSILREGYKRRNSPNSIASSWAGRPFLPAPRSASCDDKTSQTKMVVTRTCSCANSTSKWLRNHPRISSWVSSRNYLAAPKVECMAAIDPVAQNLKIGLVEQDRRAIKRRTRPMLGFKKFHCATKLIAGIETMYMIKQRQFNCPDGQVASAADQFYSLAFWLFRYVAFSTKL